MTRFLKNRKLLAAVFLGVFLAVWLMTALTPMLADDYSYSFSYAEPGERLSSLADVFRSLAAHRHSMNGRMVSHGLAMLFLMGPKAVFNLFNALNAALGLYLLCRWVYGGGRGRDLTFTLLAVFLLWEFTPVFGQVYLWLDGSLNYAWGLTAVLAFLYPFACAYRDKPCSLSRSRARKLLFPLLAFLAGAYSENASCAGLFMAFVFGALVLRDRRRLPAYLWVSFISGCLGFLFLMTAPAESARAAQHDLLGIARNIQRVFSAPQETLLPLYALFAALLVTALLCRADRRSVVAAVVVFLGSVVSVAVFVLALYFPWRSLCSTTALLILACLLLLEAIWRRGLRYLAPVLASIAAVCFVFSFALGLGDILVLHLEGRRRAETIRAAVEAGDSSVSIHQFSSNTKYAASYELPDVYDDPGLWPNYDVARYYGIGQVVGLPPVEEFGSE